MTEQQVHQELEVTHTAVSYHLSEMFQRLWPGTSVTGRHTLVMAAVLDSDPERDETGDLLPSCPTGRVLIARPGATGARDTETHVIAEADAEGERIVAVFDDGPGPEWQVPRLGNALANFVGRPTGRAIYSQRSVVRVDRDDGDHDPRYYFVFALLYLDPELPDMVGESFSVCALRHWLDEAAAASRQEDAAIHHTPDEIMLRAGDAFVSQVTATEPPNLLRVFSTSPFACLNGLAFLTYEKAETSGVIDVTTIQEEATPDIALRSPVHLSAQRQVRKLLHATHEDLGLLVCNDQVRGMRRRCGSWPLTIRFLPRGVWEVVRDGELALRVVRGSPEAPQRSPAERAEQAVAARVGGTTTATLERIRQAVDECLCRRHGATFVVSTEAAAEAQRLVQQDTQIEPIPLDGCTLADLGRVDGAVLLDPEGLVHAFGVILDGEALPVEAEDPPLPGIEGLRRQIARRRIQRSRPDPSRGSRYNSAITYSYSRVRRAHSPSVCAVVVSEDGMVTVVPTEGDLHAWREVR